MLGNKSSDSVMQWSTLELLAPALSCCSGENNPLLAAMCVRRIHNEFAVARGQEHEGSALVKLSHVSHQENRNFLELNLAVFNSRKQGRLSTAGTPFSTPAIGEPPFQVSLRLILASLFIIECMSGTDNKALWQCCTKLPEHIYLGLTDSWKQDDQCQHPNSQLSVCMDCCRGVDVRPQACPGGPPGTPAHLR